MTEHRGFGQTQPFALFGSLRLDDLFVVALGNDSRAISTPERAFPGETVNQHHEAAERGGTEPDEA